MNVEAKQVWQVNCDWLWKELRDCDQRALMHVDCDCGQAAT
jgi:hypothetical protein